MDSFRRELSEVINLVGSVDRYRGALLGLAVCDALGTTVEFKPPGTFPLVHDITGGGPFNLAPGEWTDDTSMSVCLAERAATRCAMC